MVSGQVNSQVGGPESGQVGGAERRLPPVTALAVVALTLVLAGGIYLAAHLPRPAPLALPVAALAASAAVLLAAAAVLARVRDFAWHTFFVVGGWTLAAYVVIAGMLEFVFILDHTPASLLAVFSLMLAVFAIDIPLLLAFSVARYQPAGAAGAGRDVVAPSP
jgi:hypothetical protein